MSQFDEIKSVGIGLTNKCNLNCPHCYSRNLPQKSLSLTHLQKILKLFPKVEKMNFGTGESIFNPELLKIMEFLRKQGLKMALTSNGTTVTRMKNKYLSWFKDVDLSLDFPTAKLHDRWRSPGAFKMALASLERCQKLGVNTSIALCLMNNNYRFLPFFRKILDRFNVCLRINVYKPTASSDQFSLNYAQFWEAINLLVKNFCLISTSEPILSILTKNPTKCGSPCGEKSVRVHPNGKVTPCVFLTDNKLTIGQFRKLKRTIPIFCQSCYFAEQCRGGCFSRRYLKNRVDQPDEFCPFPFGLKLPKINFRYSSGTKPDFIHKNYLCTTIVR